MNSVPNWKTNVGFTILGILVPSIILSIISAINASVGYGIALIYSVAGIWYAMSKYPSYFAGNGVSDAKSASFLNGFFGGIIFGCLWNSNLTKGNKGISNVVFTVFAAISAVSSLATLFL